MLNHFFLSYSRADSSPLLKRFFDDLCDTIRIELSLPHTQAVGFYEETRYLPASEWSDAAKQALQDSGVMVCLLSPAYLHCEHGGKEWQVFDERRRRTVEDSGAQGPFPESLAQVILPVAWGQLHGPVPTVVNQLLAHPDHIHQRQSLLEMFKSSGMSRREYNEFVRTLANHIIELTPAASNLLRLDPLPPMSEVHNAFTFWEGAANGSDKCGDRPKRYEVPCGHTEFVKAAAIRERVTNSETEGSSATIQQKPSEPAPRKRRTYYLSAAISAKRQVLDLIDDACLFSRYHVKTYEDIEGALSDAPLSLRRVPDLFVIDLDNSTQGLQRIQTFTKEWGLPSTILCLSVNSKPYTLPDLYGTTAILPNLLSGELKRLIKRCAKIGRDRRIYKNRRVRDRSRTNRPVFFSYCSDDRGAATLLTSNLAARRIEVWTMDETLHPGDPWSKEIQDAIKHTRIFVALISNSYIKSENCMKELTDFYERLQGTPVDERPLLIPVLYNKPNTSVNKFIHEDVKSYNLIEITDKLFLNGFNSLMGRIQDVLRKG